jgi:hypothetical protein
MEKFAQGPERRYPTPARKTLEGRPNSSCLRLLEPSARMGVNPRIVHHGVYEEHERKMRLNTYTYT